MSVFRFFGLALCAGCITSCSFMQPVSLPKTHRYAISPVYDHAVFSQKASYKKTVLVNRPTADMVYHTEAILYMPKPHEYKPFAVNSWVAEPAQMLRSLFFVALERLPSINAVSVSSVGSTVGYSLDTHILGFQKEYSANGPVVKVIVRAAVSDSATHRLLGQRVFQTQVSAPGGIYNMVLAFNKAARINAERIACYVLKTVQKNTSVQSFYIQRKK